MNLLDYTEQQIREMPAGREIDALVAEYVCAYHKWDNWPDDYDGAFPMFYQDDTASLGCWTTVIYDDESEDGPSRFVTFSQDIAAVWPLWEAFTEEYDDDKLNIMEDYIESKYPDGDGMPLPLLEWLLSNLSALDRCRILLLAKRAELEAEAT